MTASSAKLLDATQRLVTRNIDRCKFTMGIAGRDAIARELCRLCGLPVLEYKDIVFTPDELRNISRAIATALRDIAIERDKVR